MTNDIAQTIVYRTEPEYRFDVDGQPFPWHITEDGAKFVKTPAGLYLCTVTIFPILRNNPQPPCTFQHTEGEPPTIAGTPFPWAGTGTLTYEYEDHVPTLTLTFIAEHVDADCDIPDELPGRPTSVAESLKSLMDTWHEAVDKAVELWHNIPAGHPDADTTLADYLGMTEPEYNEWTRTGRIPTKRAAQ